MTQEIFQKESSGARWNGKQRLIAVVGVLLFVLTSILPPWLVPRSGGTTDRTWRLLFNPPTPQTGSSEIDWLTLIFMWFVILVATVALVWAFRGPLQSRDG
ncbi:MAG: hypothetical protein L0215_26710 [Gemmataceae bacterium]|nr:hypothetical protein [Gemmataceae bacterium]